MTRLTNELQRMANSQTEIDRLTRGLEGAKDWAARSGATGLEQWCAEALSSTGKLAVFPSVTTPATDPKDATIKALADALEEVRRCDKTSREHPHAAVPSPIPKVNAALRLVGR